MLALRRLNDILEKAAGAVVILFMAAICLVVFAQVFGRYVLFYSLPWSEEISRYMMVYISALGSAIALRRGAHVGLDILVRRIPGRGRVAVETAAILFALALTGVIAFFGFKLVGFNMAQRSAAMRVPMGIPYAAVPIGSLLMFLVLIEQLLARLGGEGR